MASWRRALAFGLLVWLVPFIVALSAGSLKASWRSLFESIMAVTVAATVVACALLYFRRVKTRRIEEGILAEGIKLGLLWMAISILIDLPLMLSPPISYSPVEYAADIGLTYLMMPIITGGMAMAAGLSRDNRSVSP